MDLTTISAFPVGQSVDKCPSPETVDDMAMMPENMGAISVLSVGQSVDKCPSPETVEDMAMVPENARIISATLLQLF